MLYLDWIIYMCVCVCLFFFFNLISCFSFLVNLISPIILYRSHMIDTFKQKYTMQNMTIWGEGLKETRGIILEREMRSKLDTSHWAGIQVSNILSSLFHNIPLWYVGVHTTFSWLSLTFWLELYELQIDSCHFLLIFTQLIWIIWSIFLLWDCTLNWCNNDRIAWISILLQFCWYKSSKGSGPNSHCGDDWVWTKLSVTHLRFLDPRWTVIEKRSEDTAEKKIGISC